MPTPPPTDALLCESCGYDMSSLGVGPRCPECGSNVAGAITSRVGSPAQQSRTGAAIAHCRWVLNAPRFAFTAIKVDGVSAQKLFRLTISRAALLLTLPLLLGGAGSVLSAAYLSLFHQYRVWSLDYLIGFLLVTFVFPIAFFVVDGMLRFLCWLEFQGVQFFGRQRGWRITPEIARSVIAHAAVGWLVGGGLWLVACLIAYGGIVWLRPAPIVGPRFLVVGLLALPLAALFLGLLIFESLVYLGIRSCRFANSPEVVARYLPDTQNPGPAATPGQRAE